MTEFTDLERAARDFARKQNPIPQPYGPHVPDADRARLGLEAEREIGMPANTAVGLPDLDVLLNERRARTTMEGSSALRRFMRDPINAGLARDDLETLTAVEKTANSIARGGLNIGSGAATMVAAGNLRLRELAGMTRDEALARFFPAEERRFLEGRGPQGQAAIASREASILADWQKAQTAKNLGVDFTESIRGPLAAAGSLQKTAEGLKGFEASERVRERLAPAMAAETTGEQLRLFMQAMTENPADAAIFIGETLAESSPGLIGGSLATLITRNPAAGIAVMGGSSLGMEYGGAVQEFLAENGVNLTTPEGVEALLNNRELLLEADRKGFAKGIVIAAIDALSGGVAGQALSKSPMGDVLAQAAVQAILGGGGEALGTLAAGDEINMVDVMLEAIVELAGTPVEALGVGGRALNKKIGRTNRAGMSAEALQRANEIAAASKLRERSPAKFREFVEQTEGGNATLEIPADDLNTFFQGMGYRPEDFEIDAQVFEDALATGGTVPISMGVMSEKVLNTPDAEFFLRNGTFTSEEMSAAEAERFNAEVEDIVQEWAQDYERQRADEEAMRPAEEQIYDNLYRQLRSANRSPDVAQREATLNTAWILTNAPKFKMDPLQLAQELGVRIEGPETPETRLRNSLDIAINTLRSRKGKPSGQQSLIPFLIQEGGLPGVDIPDAPQGLVIPDDGQVDAFIGENPRRIEDVASAAIEAGYLPELMWTQDQLADVTAETADPVQALMEAVERELAGTPVLPVGTDQTEAALQALEEEIARLGLSLDMTNDELVRALGAEEMPETGRRFNQAPPVGSEAFRRWFGDSKIVDENGNPAIWYKAMEGEAPNMSSGMTHAARERSNAEWYSDEGLSGGDGRRPIVEVYIKAEKPYDFNNPRHIELFENTFVNVPQKIQEYREGMLKEYGEENNPNSYWNEQPDEQLQRDLRAGSSRGDWQWSESPVVRDWFQEHGFDAVYQTADNMTSDELNIAVFSPEQIKSVNNRGTFDPNDPRILYQDILETDGDWRNAQVTVQNEEGESYTTEAGPAVDIVMDRLAEARALLECVNAG